MLVLGWMAAQSCIDSRVSLQPRTTANQYRIIGDAHASSWNLEMEDGNKISEGTAAEMKREK